MSNSWETFFAAIICCKRRAAWSFFFSRRGLKRLFQSAFFYAARFERNPEKKKRKFQSSAREKKGIRKKSCTMFALSSAVSDPLKCNFLYFKQGRKCLQFLIKCSRISARIVCTRSHEQHSKDLDHNDVAGTVLQRVLRRIADISQFCFSEFSKLSTVVYFLIFFNINEITTKSKW